MTDKDNARSPLVQRALATVGLAHKAATAYGRPDLADRLRASGQRLADPAFQVLVVGEFKQGKSSLVNALLGEDICPVDDDIATAVPTMVRWSDQPSATVVLQPPETDGDQPDLVRESIAVGDVAQYVVENPGVERQVNTVDVGLPVEMLRDGLVLVDTPGVGGLGSPHSRMTMGALPMASAVLFVTDASQEFTVAELDFMESARQLCPNLVCVVTKTDFYPAWRRIRRIDMAHLNQREIPVEIVPVSSALRHRAVESGDDELDSESGFPALIDHLRSKIVSQAEQLSVGLVASDLQSVLDQLTAHFEARRTALEDPESTRQKLAELETARARAEDLKSRAARWQQTLADGVQDLTADVDHDLRDRFRKINQECDEALEAVDPADAWAEFEPWLYLRVSEDVVNNYSFLQLQARELAERVADHFDTGNNELLIDLDVGDPTAALSAVNVEAGIDVKKMGIAGQAMTAVRGGYMSTLMVPGLAGILGLALTAASPIVLGLGLAMGRKQVRDEKDRQLAQRRAEARNAQRKYMDEATFLSNKESRDSLRRLQRQLRDYFTDRAEEQATFISEMVGAVQSAAQADEADRSRQLNDVKAELTRLADLQKRITALDARPAPTGGQG